MRGQGFPYLCEDILVLIEILALAHEGIRPAKLAVDAVPVASFQRDWINPQGFAQSPGRHRAEDTLYHFNLLLVGSFTE
jgi:hypothetical protein